MTDTDPAITESNSRGNMKRDHFREMPKGPPPALQPKPTLTDAEREAIERAAFALNGGEDWSPDVVTKDKQACATLRKLLERLK
jgi:hypothetical protein